MTGKVALRRKGKDLWGQCPFHTEKTASFHINVERGYYHCFGCGAHGDPIKFLMETRGLSFRDAVGELLGMPAQAPAAPARPQPKAAPAPPDHSVQAILAKCRPIDRNKGAGLYLWSRELGGRDQPGLLEHPSLLWSEAVDGPAPEGLPWRRWQTREGEWYRGREFPALIAPITNSANKVTAIQRIWVAETWIDGPDFRAPVSTRKKTLGTMGDGAVRLRPARPTLGLAEGVETAIAVMERRSYAIPVWAVCGLSRLGYPGHWREVGIEPARWFPPDRPPEGVEAQWIPERIPSVWIPPEVEALEIYGDNGEDAHRVAEHAARWYAKHRRIFASAFFPDPPYSDFNDQLMEERAHERQRRSAAGSRA